MREPTDDELVARVLAGEREAFAGLIERHARIVHRVVWTYLRATDAAIDHDDAVQEAWVRAYARLATYVPSGRFGAWVGTIAANYCRDLGRRRRLATVLPDLLPARADPAPGPEALALRRELGDELGAALATLTPHQRGAVLLCAAQGRDHAEAGRVLGVSATTIKMRMWAGRRRLRTLLAGM